MQKLLTTLLIASAFIPVFAFAATGNQDFAPIVTQLTAYLTGSLGSVFIFLGFLGACAAVAGFASMKVMFPVLGLSLALKFGPQIITAIFGATGDSPIAMLKNHVYIIDIFILFAAVVVFAIGFVKYKNKKEKDTQHHLKNLQSAKGSFNPNNEGVK